MQSILDGGMKPIIDEVLQMSPPILLALVINIVVSFLKKAPFIQKWHVPIMAAILGGIAYPFIAETGKVAFTVRNPEVYNVLIGVAIGGLAVLFNQLFWLGKERMEERKDMKAQEKFDTEFLKRKQDPSIPITIITPPNEKP